MFVYLRFHRLILVYWYFSQGLISCQFTTNLHQYLSCKQHTTAKVTSLLPWCCSGQVLKFIFFGYIYILWYKIWLYIIYILFHPPFYFSFFLFFLNADFFFFFSLNRIYPNLCGSEFSHLPHNYLIFFFFLKISQLHCYIAKQIFLKF